MNFKTDLNARERQRFAGQLRDISKAAAEAADALAASDDSKFVISYLGLIIQGSIMKELQEILSEQLEKMRTESTEFPSFLEEKPQRN